MRDREDQDLGDLMLMLDLWETPGLDWSVWRVAVAVGSCMHALKSLHLFLFFVISPHPAITGGISFFFSFLKRKWDI